MKHHVSAAKGGSQTKTPPRERILKAADELFERYGIRGVGVEAIAEAAETNKMTLYRHFSSKDELVATWLQGLVDEWTAQWEELEQMPPQTDPQVQLNAFLKAYGDAFECFAARGCPMLNSLAELKEKDHPARLVIDGYKAATRERMIVFFGRIGVSEPEQAAEEFQLLLDGAKAGVEDIGVARSRERFIQLAKTLLRARMAEGEAAPQLKASLYDRASLGLNR